MINIIEDSHVIASDEYERTENDSVVMFVGFCRQFPQAMLLKRIFFIHSLVSMLANFLHAWYSSREVNLDWPYIRKC